MDSTALVTERLHDGGRFLRRFAADGAPIDVGFWAETTDERHWFLYVSTSLYDALGPTATYRAVQSSLQKISARSLAGSSIKVVSPSNPIVRDLVSVLPLEFDQGIWLDSRTIGGVEVEQVFVYPPVRKSDEADDAMTPDEVGRMLLRLLSLPTESAGSVLVALTDGSRFRGRPFGLVRSNAQPLVAQFVTDESDVRFVPFDEIAWIS